MVKYSELSKKRKMMVDVIIEHIPAVSLTGTITFKEIRSLWLVIQKKRAEGTMSKLGYPLWITVEKEFRTGTRGVYYVPVPTLEEAAKSNFPKIEKMLDSGSKKGLTTKQSDTKMDDVLTEDEFKKELAEAGIEL